MGLVRGYWGPGNSIEEYNVPGMLDLLKSAGIFMYLKGFEYAQAREKYQAKSFRNNTNLTTTSTIMDKIFETKFKFHVKYHIKRKASIYQ